MDEQKLTDLFEAAVHDVPPASFDELDVAKESRRVTQRRRSVFAGGSALAIVVLAVGLLVSTGGFGQTPGGTSTSAGAAIGAVRQSDTTRRTFGNAMVPPEPAGSRARAQSGTAFPVTPPMQGGGGTGGAGSHAGGTPSGCGPTDRELAVALANELPSVGATSFVEDDSAITALSCPSGSRVAAYRIQAGPVEGDVIAVLAPAGGSAGEFGARAGSVSASAPASGGRMLTVVAEPLAGSPTAPLAARVDDIAVTVAAGL